MFRLASNATELATKNVIVLPMEYGVPEGWRLMRRQEVLEEFETVLSVVEGLPQNVNIALHEDSYVLSNIGCRRRPWTSKGKEDHGREFMVRMKRVRQTKKGSDSVQWRLLRKKPKSRIRKHRERMDLTFNEIWDFTRSQLMATIGPHPTQITLSFLHFSTGTYVEDDSYWKTSQRSSWMNQLSRRFNIFLDFHTKYYTMCETVGGLVRKTIGTFSYDNSTVREYAKTNEGFRHCLTLKMHPKKVINPNLPMFKPDFRFHIMAQSLVVRWFPSYGICIGSNGGESQHFLKWQYYDCKMETDVSDTFNDTTFGGGRRSKFGRRFKKADAYYFR